MDAEDRELGRVAMHDILPRLSRTPGTWRRAAPSLGEHTDAILTEAGLEPETIARLRQQGAAA